MLCFHSLASVDEAVRTIRGDDTRGTGLQLFVDHPWLDIKTARYWDRGDCCARILTPAFFIANNFTVSSEFTVSSFELLGVRVSSFEFRSQRSGSGPRPELGTRNSEPETF